jgi:hypothetical protein
MAKPRIFVSSTYYDLKHIRNSLEAFIQSFGYETVLFESGDIPFHYDTTLDVSCYGEIQNCHMLILIVGGRYGSPSSDSGDAALNNNGESVYQIYNSITKREYETARQKDIPIFIFVDKNVLAEYETFKSNRENATVIYAHVDNINIFYLLDDILVQKRNNYIRKFEHFDDISSWLRDQWGGLFADFLSRKSSETTLRDLSSQIAELQQVTSVLKEYTESIMRKIEPQDFQKIIIDQEKQLVYAKARRFTSEPMIEYLLSASSKEYADNNTRQSTATKIFEAFKCSSSVEDFLQKAEFPERFRKRMLALHPEDLRKEYQELYSRYVIHQEPLEARSQDEM